MSMTYYMVRVIKHPHDRRWYLKVGENYAGRRFVNFNTCFGGFGLVFSGGNAHYLREQSKEEQQTIKDFEHRPIPYKKDGTPDMRYKWNKIL